MGGSRIGEGRRSVTSGAPRRRAARRAIGASVALLSLLGGGCGEGGALEPVQISLLAVGDGGVPPLDLDHYARHRAVARAMTTDPRAHALHALVLLGDNFAPHGLRSEELTQRVRANLVLPFCPFLELAGPRSAAVSDACATPEEARHPVPIYAVLGNHDYAAPESPALQREAVPEFVSNWRMPAGASDVYTVGSGLSLVAFDSDPVFRGGSAAPLAEALRRAEGPWRIVAAHHPVAVVGRGAEAERYARYRERVLAAVAAAGVTVHIFLTGHEHNLQVLVMDHPAPALHVVAGGGSGGRSIHDDSPWRRAGFESPGYARIDLVGEGDGQRLVASLYRIPPFPLSLARDRVLAARWSVDREGNVRPDSPTAGGIR